MLDTRGAYKRKGKLPSGSGGKISKNWSLAACMKFLDRYNYPTPTTSSVQSEDDEGDEQVTEDKDPEQGSSVIATPTTSDTDTRRRCDCLASSAPFTNIQTYLLTYKETHWQENAGQTYENRSS